MPGSCRCRGRGPARRDELGAERAVPEGGDLGGVDGIAVAVARHRDRRQSAVVASSAGMPNRWPSGGGGRVCRCAAARARTARRWPAAGWWTWCSRPAAPCRGRRRRHAVDGSFRKLLPQNGNHLASQRTGDGVPCRARAETGPAGTRMRAERHLDDDPTMIHRLPRRARWGLRGTSWVQYAPNAAGPGGGTGCRRRPPRSARPRRAAWSRSAAPAPGRADRHPRHAPRRTDSTRGTTPPPPCPPRRACRPPCAWPRAPKPVASSSNNANVDDRRNAGRNVSNRTRHEAGKVRPGSIGGTPSRG